MGLKDRINTWLKQREMADQKELEAAALQETKEKVIAHAKGGEKILDEFDKIDFAKYLHYAQTGENMIRPETIQGYEAVVNQIRQIIMEEPLSDVETDEIDSSLAEMVDLFGTSLENGKESTATQILKGIGEGVKFMRTPYVYSNEEEQKEKHRKRQREINKLLILANSQTYIDKTANQITDLDIAIEEQKEKKKEADNLVDSLESEDPEIEDKATEADMGERKVTPEILRYVNAVNAALEAGNNVANSQLMREEKVKRMQTVESAINKINLMAFGSTELFGNIAFERFEKLHEDFVDDVKQAYNEMQHLNEMNKQVDSTLDTMFQAAINDESIGNLIQYHEERRKEEQEEKAKAKAREQQKIKEEQKLKEQQIHVETHKESEKQLIAE